MLNRKMSTEEPAIPTKLLWHSNKIRMEQNSDYTWLISFAYCKSCFLINWLIALYPAGMMKTFTVKVAFLLHHNTFSLALEEIQLSSNSFDLFSLVTLYKEKLCRNLKFKRIWHLENFILGIWAFNSWNQNSYFIFSVEIKVACQYLLGPPWLTMHIGWLWSGLEETEKLLCHKAEQNTGLIGCL